MPDLNHIDIVVLCGGFGKRLQPVLSNVPKVLAPFGQKPFLDLMVDYLEAQGFGHIILATGYKEDVVRSYFDGRKAGKSFVEYSTEEKPLGTGGAVDHARPLLKSDLFVVINGDSFCPLDYPSFIRSHNNHLASVVVSKVENAGDYGTVDFDPSSGQVSGFREKTKSAAGFVNAGIYCFSRHALKMFHQPSSLEKDILPELAKQGSLYAYPTDQEFFDIGTPERYSKAQKILTKAKEK